MIIDDLLWRIALLAGVVTAALFLYGDRALAQVIGTAAAMLAGAACLWSFWQPRH